MLKSKRTESTVSVSKAVLSGYHLPQDYFATLSEGREECLAVFCVAIYFREQRAKRLLIKKQSVS